MGSLAKKCRNLPWPDAVTRQQKLESFAGLGAHGCDNHFFHRDDFLRWLSCRKLSMQRRLQTLQLTPQPGT